MARLNLNPAAAGPRQPHPLLLLPNFLPLLWPTAPLPALCGSYQRPLATAGGFQTVYSRHAASGLIWICKVSYVVVRFIQFYKCSWQVSGRFSTLKLEQLVRTETYIRAGVSNIWGLDENERSRSQHPVLHTHTFNPRAKFQGLESSIHQVII